MSIALSLPGGGLSGALYQVGALAALYDGIDGLRDDGVTLFLGQAGGSVVAACLAAGVSPDRLYRALLDPADNYFPLERRHLLRFDTHEWERALHTAGIAFRKGVSRLDPRRRKVDDPPFLELFVEQFDRLGDSLPAGLFTLDRFERFLADFFLRRGIPNVFGAMPQSLRIVAHDLDSGERVLFGSDGFDVVPVSLACAASCALPLFFSPVRIGDRHYIDGGLCELAHLGAAHASGADLSIVINPRVPVRASRDRSVPTGHGPRTSVRDKGMAWVFNQAKRISSQAMIEQEVRHPPTGMRVLLIEPEASDTVLFLQNPTNLEARRLLLEHAYRTTRSRIASWIETERTWHDLASSRG